VANPFSSALHRGVEDVARRRDVLVLAGSVDEEPERERDLALSLVARRVDGLIVVPTGDDQSYLINERRAGVNVVFADRPPKQLKADSVVSDNHTGALVATNHLIASGHRRIGFLCDLLSIQTAADRMTGYVDALREAGIPKDAALMRHELHSIEQAEAAARALLLGPAPPTAFFASQNLVTIGAMSALRALGLQKHVALVGFDNFLLADLLEPAVTVVAQDPSAMGELAAEILFRRMDGDESPPKEYTIPTRLITRGSGEIPPQERGQPDT
jgi:LacI family transcriptional regulator